MSTKKAVAGHPCSPCGRYLKFIPGSKPDFQLRQIVRCRHRMNSHRRHRTLDNYCKTWLFWLLPTSFFSPFLNFVGFFSSDFYAERGQKDSNLRTVSGLRISGALHFLSAMSAYRGQRRTRTFGVSCVTDLQSAAFAAMLPAHDGEGMFRPISLTGLILPWPAVHICIVFIFFSCFSPCIPLPSTPWRPGSALGCGPPPSGCTPPGAVPRRTPSGPPAHWPPCPAAGR